MSDHTVSLHNTVIAQAAIRRAFRRTGALAVGAGGLAACSTQS
jgi:hypothetical protein